MDLNSGVTSIGTQGRYPGVAYRW